MRSGGRQNNQLRTWKFERFYTRTSPGSVLVHAGGTTVLCTASVDESVPPWLKGKGKGWVTAEYNMLPGSTAPRKTRERGGKVDGRTAEIQRLIGRCLRSVIDMTALGERTITVDCDVLEADGGTRTASATGGFVALVDAVWSIRGSLADPVRFPISDSVAAISVGIIAAGSVLDLDYQEDVAAHVDMNVAMTGRGRFIEVQGTGEGATFSESDLHQMLALAREGAAQLTSLQRESLSDRWNW